MNAPRRLPLFPLFLLPLLTLGWAAAAMAAEGGEPVLRDYPSPFFLAPHQLEISADYLVMNSTVDVLNVREGELDAVDSALADSLGDLEGGRLLVNYGLFARTNLHAEYSRREIEMGLGRFDINTAELALRQGVPLPWHGLALAVEGGARGNWADDLSFTRVADIDRFVRRIDPETSISETASHVIISTGEGTVFVPKADKPPLDAELEAMHDLGFFLRLLLGAEVGPLRPSAFVEVGHTRIDSRIDSNVATFVGGSVAAALADRFPVDLDRSEEYLKGGVQLALTLFDRLTLQSAYEYLRLDRDSGLQGADDNHIVRADATWYFTPQVGLNIGGVYYRRQFNGVIPFLYNRYSRTTFDHDYGVLSLGLIGRWGG